MLCKLDIEKAYDQISWKFLFTMLQEMGFGSKWMAWIKWCITTASFSILVNGRPAGVFRSSRVPSVLVSFCVRNGSFLHPY